MKDLKNKEVSNIQEINSLCQNLNNYSERYNQLLLSDVVGRNLIESMKYDIQPPIASGITSKR